MDVFTLGRNSSISKYRSAAEIVAKNGDWTVGIGDEEQGRKLMTALRTQTLRAVKKAGHSGQNKPSICVTLGLPSRGVGEVREGTPHL